jgi:hypothetical protein
LLVPALGSVDDFRRAKSIDDRVSAGGVFEVKTGWLVRLEPHERHLVTVLVLQPVRPVIRR